MRFIYIAVVLYACLAGCDSDNGTKPPSDTTPPSKVEDLAVNSQPNRSVILTWTAPGDDGMQGRASRYQIRYSGTLLTEQHWDSATSIASVPVPKPAGQSELLLVSGLADGLCHFALRAEDEIPNISPMSNVVSATIADRIPPAAVVDLIVSTQTATSVTLAWTAPGNDGTSGRAFQYELRHAPSSITEGSWPTATPVEGVPAPDQAGTRESFTIGGLATGQTYYFALKTADQALNWSELSNVASVLVADVIPPGMVTDLTACSASSDGITLAWTAPGGDGALGRAAEYDIRYFTYPLSEANWEIAFRAEDPPAPAEPGTVEYLTLYGLARGEMYYFALRTADHATNWSRLSNLAAGIPSEITSPRRLTLGFGPGVGAMNPAWSPDGEHIAFESDWSGNREIYAIPVSCGPIVQVTLHNEFDGDPSWAPDAEKIAFISGRGGKRELWITDTARGSDLVKIASHDGDVVYCTWSPDGSTIAYSVTVPSGTWIYLVRPAGGTPHALVDHASVNTGPAFSPDGSLLAFASNRSGNPDIWVVPVGGGDAVQLTGDSSADIDPCWSPDGSRIAFSSMRSGNFDIWVMSASGGDATPLTFDPAFDLQPTWSPDGTRIAFASRRSGRYEIWIQEVQ